ncbi:MAG: tRNA (guanosine(46)-N7)-methyltransferase TrmB [Treponema sp.]
MELHSSLSAHTAQQTHSIKTFVMRKGHITDAQKKAYQDFAPRWCIPYKTEMLNFQDIFGNTNPVIMEIGFGMGTATAEIAAQNPHINYLGIEVFQAGVGKLLSEIENRHIENIRIIEHDAIEVLETMIPDVCLAGFHVFFPDPWQKKKHHKRRLMHRPRTALLAQKLKENGYMYMVTDWKDYADDAFTELSATIGLCSKFEGFAPPQTWRPQTKFEYKGLKKSHTIYELFFIRKTAP